MNFITCAALLCLHIDWISNDKRVVFFACFVFAVSGLTVATLFKKEVKKDEFDKKKVSDDFKVKKFFAPGINFGDSVKLPNWRQRLNAIEK